VDFAVNGFRVDKNQYLKSKLSYFVQCVSMAKIATPYTLQLDKFPKRVPAF